MYFTRKLAGELKETGRNSTARSYICAVERFISFTNKPEMVFQDINPALLKEFEKRLLMEGKARNTVSMYMRMLRSVCNQANHRNITDLSPLVFKDVFTGTDNCQKRAVSTKLITLLGKMDHDMPWSIAFARDVFLLSFYLRGIPFVDLAFLRKSDIQSGVLCYRRSKTKKLLTVILEPCAKAIFKKYTRYVKISPYALPIINRPGENEYLQYQSALRLYNKNLRKISTMLGLQTVLTSYVARHSWATAAYREGIPVSIISEALGHTSEQVTYHYLTSFDNATLRNANQKVLSLIGKEPGVLQLTSHQRITRVRKNPHFLSGKQ